MALLCDVVVAEGDGCLSKFVEQLWLLDLLCCLEGNLDVSTLKGEVVSLLGVLLKEESDLAVALLFQVAYDGSATELTTSKNLPYFSQILLLKCALEEIVSVVNFVRLHLTASSQGVESVAHEL